MRCAEHGLATGPDGRCVLCRRNATSATGSPMMSLVVAGSIAVAVIAATLGYVWVARHRQAIVAEQTDPVRAVGGASGAMLNEPTAGHQTDPTPTPEFERAHSDPPAPTTDDVPPSTSPSAASADAPTANAPPTNADVAAAVHAVPITLYAASWCPACRRTRAFLDANGLAYRAYDIDTDADAKRRMRALNPASTIPTLEIDGRVLVAPSERTLMAAVVESVRRHTGIQLTARPSN